MATTTTAPLVTFLLRIADDNLVLAQRLGALLARMPELEEDIAVANVCLDHLGQARTLYGRAAELEGLGRTEDDLAMLREDRAFYNATLVEQPDTDFAHTIVRQFFVDAYQVPLYGLLVDAGDPVLAGIAEKAVKEARYHLRRSSTWMVRLGDGTEESHSRIQAAVDFLWRYTGDLLATDEVEAALVAEGVIPRLDDVRVTFDATVRTVLEQATLTLPADPYQRLGGRVGVHTEHLGHLLPEMQRLYRSHPGARW